MNPKQLKVILEDHKLWLEDSNKGSRADLYGANLSGADLYGANLSGAIINKNQIDNLLKSLNINVKENAL